MKIPLRIKVPPKIGNACLKLAMKAKNKRPEIFLAIGLGMGVAGVIITGVNTWNNKEKLIEDSNAVKYFKNYDPDEVVQSNPGMEPLTPDDVYYNLVEAKKNFIIDAGKTYLVPFVLVVGSFGFIIGGHVILRHELSTMTAAYALLMESYKKYRQNVINDIGIEKDQEYAHGIKMVDAIDPETGEIVKKAITQREKGASIYARYFDEGDFDSETSKWIWRNPNWCSNKLENIRRVKRIQAHLNDEFHTRGWMLLNEAYTAYGLPCTEAGAIVGWVLGSGHDDFIDVGVFPNFQSGKYQLPVNRLFLDERNPQNSCLLDFNVDGPIDYIFKNILEYDNRSYIVGNKRKLLEG